MKILNFENLAATPLRRAALEIAEAGLQAIDTKNFIKNMVSLRDGVLQIGQSVFSLDKINRLVVIGVGKCAMESGTALGEILGDQLSGGILLDIKNAPSATPPGFKIFKGTHPLPSEANLEASRAIVDFLKDMKENDLLIYLISGGGSTLLCLPESGKCEEESIVVESLMKSGATIQETNTVRKHISYARGGFLAKYAYPANVVSLIFSDVPGDNIEFIASGPTVKDSTTAYDARRVLDKYKIRTDRTDSFLIETPKEEKYFAKVKNILAVSNGAALAAMDEKARLLGFNSAVKERTLQGEAADVAEKIAAEINAANPNTVFLYGGETTVTAEGKNGEGGRNLELAASALKSIKDNEIIISLASDGHDNGPYAGAVCDILTKKDIESKDLDLDTYLENHDTYPLFRKAGNYILTGDTESNVSDLIIAIKP